MNTDSSKDARAVQAEKTESAALSSGEFNIQWYTFFIPLGVMLAHHYIWMYLSFVATLFSGMFTDGLMGRDLVRANELVSLIVNILLSILMSFVYIKIIKHQNRRKGGDFLYNAVKFSDIPGIAFFSLALLGASGLLMSSFLSLSKEFSSFANYMDEYLDMMSSMSGAKNVLYSLIAYGIFIPIVEELLFRGVILGEFRKAMPPAWALIAHALIFAILHFQIVQASYAFLGGLILGAIYLYYRSIYASILAHMIFNILGGVLRQHLGETHRVNEIVVYLSLFCFVAATLLVIYKGIQRSRNSRQVNV